MRRPVSHRRRRPDFYRDEARALRDIASNVPAGPYREDLLKVALEYEQLADSVEKTERRGKETPPTG